MTPLVAVFTTSGVALVVLLFSKKLEERKERQLLIFSLISKGDTRIRQIYHLVIHLYLEVKERVSFFIEKQAPIHTRNTKNKLLSYLKDKREQYANNMRDSKLLKKSDGISEFFKSINEIQKGNGEIHDSLDDGFQER